MNNNDLREGIPGEAIEAFARSFFKESSAYGFSHLDQLRFVNLLLDFSMNQDQRSKTKERKAEKHSPGLARSQAPGVYGKLPIKSERLGIRMYDSSGDRALIKDWLSDRHGRYFMLSRTTSRHTPLDELLDNESNHFGIIVMPDGTPIGSMAFLDYDPLQRKAEMRKLIGVPQMRGRGLGKAATRFWIKYGIEGLGLKKIYLNTLNIHIRNIRLNEELGFKFEGILRNEVFFDGKYHDTLRMGMCTE